MVPVPQSLQDLIRRQLRLLHRLYRMKPTGAEPFSKWVAETRRSLEAEIGPAEASAFEAVARDVYESSGEIGLAFPRPVVATRIEAYLNEMLDEIAEHGLPIRVSRATTHVPSGTELALETTLNTVFIVHGHDEVNLLRLEKLLRGRWHLEPVVLSFEPGKGRTLIEKFEEEATRASYAFALFSPDDFVAAPGSGYFQARPNVIFEMGWFFGRLGRDRVCILFKKARRFRQTWTASAA